MDVTGDRSKVRCCEEQYWKKKKKKKRQYYIGIWNVRSMDQGKLEVVKQEMARVNINILGISSVQFSCSVVSDSL